MPKRSLRGASVAGIVAMIVAAVGCALDTSTDDSVITPPPAGASTTDCKAACTSLYQEMYGSEFESVDVHDCAFVPDPAATAPADGGAPAQELKCTVTVHYKHSGCGH